MTTSGNGPATAGRDHSRIVLTTSLLCAQASAPAHSAAKTAPVAAHTTSAVRKTFRRFIALAPPCPAPCWHRRRSAGRKTHRGPATLPPQATRRFQGASGPPRRCLGFRQRLAHAPALASAGTKGSLLQRPSRRRQSPS